MDAVLIGSKKIKKNAHIRFIRPHDLGGAFHLNFPKADPFGTRAGSELIRPQLRRLFRIIPQLLRYLPAKFIYGVTAGKNRKRNAIPKHRYAVRSELTAHHLRLKFKLCICHEYALLCSLHFRISAVLYSLFRTLQNNARHIFFFPNEKKKENPERILLHLTFSRRYNIAHAHPA